MNIEQYRITNKAAIKEVFITAFSTSSKEEGEIIGDLVEALMNDTPNGDIYGFTASEDGSIIGSIFFSRVKFVIRTETQTERETDIDAFILSPVAIHPNFQKQGIGQKLINFGISFLRDLNVELVFTYGDPAYYSKVGFQQISEELIKAPYTLSQPIGWLCQRLDGGAIQAIQGESRCVSALSKAELW